MVIWFGINDTYRKGGGTSSLTHWLYLARFILALKAKNQRSILHITIILSKIIYLINIFDSSPYSSVVIAYTNTVEQLWLASL